MYPVQPFCDKIAIFGTPLSYLEAVEEEPVIDNEEELDDEQEVDDESEEPVSCSAPSSYEELKHSLGNRIEAITAADIDNQRDARKSARRLRRLVAATTR